MVFEDPDLRLRVVVARLREGGVRCLVAVPDLRVDRAGVRMAGGLETRPLWEVVVPPPLGAIRRRVMRLSRSLMES